MTGGGDPSVLEPIPANARVDRYVPFGELFRHASAVVTNGGFGTVQLAITHGLPLVVAGRTEDKAEVSARASQPCRSAKACRSAEKSTPGRGVATRRRRPESRSGRQFPRGRWHARDRFGMRQSSGRILIVTAFSDVYSFIAW